MGKSSGKKKRRHRNTYEYRRSFGQGSSSFDEDYNEASASSACSESDIPGYYFDKEKKKYFKILPNSQSSVTSFVTNETLKKKKDEDRRLLDRKKASGEYEGSNTTTIATTSSPSPHNNIAPRRPLSFEPLLKVLSSVQCGQYTCGSLQRYTWRQRCRNLKPQPGWESGKYATFDSFNRSDGDILRLEVSAGCDKAVSVWLQKGIMLNWMQLVNLSVGQKKQASTSCGSDVDLSIYASREYIGHSTNKVTSLCWSPLSELPEKACVLYTTVCPIGYSGSRVSIINLEATSALDAHKFNFDLGRYSVWSCAWNKHRSRFSVGCERQIQVIDVHSRCQWTYYTYNSDCLAQLFSPTNAHILYTGTRSGFVLTMDMRTHRSNQASAKFNHNHPVVCLKSQRDENYLMASDYSGLIRTWDLRFQKTVKRYTGLVNSHYQLPFYLDNTETFVYATGSDGYCKVWDVKDEILLKSIPPPLSLHSAEGFPVSHLSESWGGIQGNFGLVTAMSNRFFLYS